MNSEIKPCPFCGAGKTEITEGPKVWLGMRYGDPTSVSVRHWCPTVAGQPSRMIERVGRDRQSAIAAWNHRSAPAVTDGEPDIALLASMATCLRHDFGLLEADRQKSILADMRKLWDEVAGRGYYSRENRGRYLSTLAAALETPDV